MATEYGGAYGDGPWPHAAPPYGGQPPSRARRGRQRWFAAVAALILGVAGLAVALTGIVFQLLPRQFSAEQQRQITDWEVGKRWRTMSAGAIFPASLQYSAPSVLTDPNLRLTADRIGIASQASCAAATDPAAVGAALARHGCEAMLRATYVDGTGSYVITVGVAAMPGSAQVNAAKQELAGVGVSNGAGVRTVPVAGSLAAAFTDARRQLSASMTAGPYFVFYTIGYTDDRPHQPVSDDKYGDAEMTAAGAGVARAVASQVGKAVPPPQCPGTPGC
ncbi:MAG: hypothetical protein ACRDL9_00910 [Trebonia sp.]